MVEINLIKESDAWKMDTFRYLNYRRDIVHVLKVAYERKTFKNLIVNIILDGDDMKGDIPCKKIRFSNVTKEFMDDLEFDWLYIEDLYYNGTYS